MYKVGQVLFTITKEGGNKVIPIKIIEKVTITDIESETIEYKVILPIEESKKIPLSKFDKLFESLDEVNNYLFTNAKNNIVKILNETKELTSFFNSKDEKSLELDKVISDNQECKNEDEYVIIDLGDGKKAKIKPDFIAP